MGFPALDLGGYQRRSTLPQEYLDFVEGIAPGFIAQKIKSWTSRIYSQLRKRYDGTIPWGQTPAAFDISGTNPPLVMLQGIPTVGSVQVIVQITTGGPVGTALFTLSVDGGASSITNQLTAASFPLPGTGLSIIFPAGTYSTDNVFSAPAPVPEAVLTWLTYLTDWDVLRKRGANANSPNTSNVFEQAQTALAEVKEASDSKEGLFDLPVNDNGMGAQGISSGGPLWYTEVSPYISADQQQYYGTIEDSSGTDTAPPTGESGGN